MTNSSPLSQSSYQPEDIQEILKLAITRQASTDEVSGEQLLEIASELEISPEILQAAELEWRNQQSELTKRKAFDLYRQSQLKKQVGRFVIVNGALMSLNVLGAGVLSWSLYILVLWGLGLSLKLWNQWHWSSAEYEQAFQAWYRTSQVKDVLGRLWAKVYKAWQT